MPRRTGPTASGKCSSPGWTTWRKGSRSGDPVRSLGLLDVRQARLCHRQQNLEGASLARRTIRSNHPPMQLHDALADGQTHPRAFVGAVTVETLERLKDASGESWMETDSIVLDGDAADRSGSFEKLVPRIVDHLRTNSETHRRIGAPKFESVANEIGEQLPDLGTVGLYRDFSFHLHVGAGVSDGQLIIPQHVCEDLVESNRGRRNSVRRDAREGEQVLKQPVHAQGSRGHALEEQEGISS